MRTSLATQFNYHCPNCDVWLTRDRKRRGFVHHLDRPQREDALVTTDGYCALDHCGKNARTRSDGALRAAATDALQCCSCNEE